MAVYVFPGQGSQKPGMGKELYDANPNTAKHFDHANEVLGYDLTKVMFEGTEEDLKQTDITQPAVFLNSAALYFANFGAETPDAVAGHSLGEFTALLVAGVLSFDDGLRLVHQRAQAMQAACAKEPSTMAAILGLENKVVEDVCAAIDGVVVPANYNCPGQLVISGAIEPINEAVEILKEKGARRALVLNVGGAFHSPLMQPAADQLSDAINNTTFNDARCPIYQNVDGKPVSDAATIKENLIKQLTAPVKWTQTMQHMVADDHKQFVEVGGRVLSGFFKKLDRSLETSNI